MGLPLNPTDPIVAFGAFAALVFVGFLGNAAFAYLRLNDTLLLMGLGVLLGPVTHWIEPSAMRPISAVAGPLALVLILFDGGLGLKFKDLLHGVGNALALAFLGFGFTIGAVAAILVVMTGAGWIPALAFGAIVGGTSSVIVITSLAYIRSTKKTDTALAVESAITDILVVVAVFALVKIAVAQATPTAAGIAGRVGGLFGASLLIGALSGFLWLLLAPAVKDKPFGYMLTLAFAFVVYIVAEQALAPISSGGGPLAVLALGILLGNADSLGRFWRRHVGDTYGSGLKRFQGELTFIVRTFFFIALGVLIEPTLLADGTVLLTGLALFGATAVARYLAVGWTTRNPVLGREGWVMFMMMPRGLAAAVMAAVPFQAGVVGSEHFVAYAFIIVALSNVASTVGGFILGGPKPLDKPAPDFAPKVGQGTIVDAHRRTQHARVQSPRPPGQS